MGMIFSLPSNWITRRDDHEAECENDFGPAVAFNHCFVCGVGFGVADGSAAGVWVPDAVDSLLV